MFDYYTKKSNTEIGLGMKLTQTANSSYSGDHISSLKVYQLRTDTISPSIPKWTDLVVVCCRTHIITIPCEEWIFEICRHYSSPLAAETTLNPCYVAVEVACHYSTRNPIRSLALVERRRWTVVMPLSMLMERCIFASGRCQLGKRPETAAVI